jgi:predicted phosphodiesterase
MAISIRRLAILLVVAAGPIWPRLLTPVWTETGEGFTVARVVVNGRGDCPVITVDGAPHPMRVRTPVPAGLRPACEWKIPAAAHSASVDGKELALPHPDPSRIAVIGDTGCRIKLPAVQDCNDPAKWPFHRVAGQAAASKPDLVIHVGDYLYRESPCPPESQAKCAGTPIGDTWEAWNADFFEPAAPLLAAAPWAFARGNHEDCERAWRGWFYYLDPRPFRNSCNPYSAPYLVTLGSWKLVVFDSATASASRDLDPKGMKRYASRLAQVHANHAWFVQHHPMWGLRVGAQPTDPPLETSSNVTKAWEKSPPQGIDFILSGHTHLFELLSFDHGRPPQLVAGDGGTEMGMPVPARVAGLRLNGATLLSAQDAHEFGYTALTKTAAGWQLALTGVNGRVIETAKLPIP